MRIIMLALTTSKSNGSHGSSAAAEIAVILCQRHDAGKPDSQLWLGAFRKRQGAYDTAPRAEYRPTVSFKV